MDVLGANRCISSDEWAIIGPDCCKRLVNVFVAEIGITGATAAFDIDFLYGEAFCGRIATAGTATNRQKILNLIV